MLVEWVDKNKGQILEDFKEMTGGEIEIYNGNMRIIEKGYRDKKPIALVEKTIGNEKEYIVAFYYTTKQDKLEWAYGYYYDELGGLKVAYILGEKTVLPQESNLQITAMNLQKLFVKMTEKGGGEND